MGKIKFYYNIKPVFLYAFLIPTIEYVCIFVYILLNYQKNLGIKVMPLIVLHKNLVFSMVSHLNHF